MDDVPGVAKSRSVTTSRIDDRRSCTASGPGLDVHQRCLISVGIVAAQGRYEELATQVRGAVTSGCTQEEIQEAILQAAVFGGRDAARKSLHVADTALKGLARWRPRR
ncbi:carboxymuconolactone decarboxylase family protein [Rhodococcus globerulus]|uniref:carboxymuconolactone decarboxylase family protein n=1 Tax=Rhodococcus globerulus TaxID=33008 RepID=UPI00374F3367